MIWHLYCLVLTNFQVLGDNFLAVAIHQNPNEFWWNSWGLLFCPLCGRSCTAHPMYLSHIKRLNVFNQYCSKENLKSHILNPNKTTLSAVTKAVILEAQLREADSTCQGITKRDRELSVNKESGKSPRERWSTNTEGLSVEWDVKDGGRKGFSECSRKSIGSGTLSRSK